MTSDRFFPIALPELLKTSLAQLNAGHYFNIPRDWFYIPQSTRLGTKRFGQQLGTPLGPAAGPHTQLSQNIVGAWLCGARYIELKTIQTLDELEVPKPCIDLQDEGYNCEWSQELRIPQSFDQYLDAWIMIHLLSHHLGWENQAKETIFNMSVGYNLEGILKPNVQWFFEKMHHCKAELSQKIQTLSQEHPWVKQVEIPHQISHNITLSTMHGCPPDEIEKIGMYLIREKGLHTVVKLNPTLLGPDQVRGILNEQMGFKTPVPDQAFEHDLKYADAVKIIRNLTEAADQKKVSFGLKLTNTLESNNFRNVFSKEQKQMYMSGIALHPLAVNLAKKIRSDFPDIDISFSGGADCFNISDLLACNLSPVTVSSDLLKPGGYGRLSQYLCHIEKELTDRGLEQISQLMSENPSENLKNYCASLPQNLRNKKALREPNIKTLRPLEAFDCIHAPCMSTCPGNQNIPQYMHYVANGQWQNAFEVIMRTNPFPSVTGTVCDHECQTKCTRIHYDDALAIREIKRYVASFEHNEDFISALPHNGFTAAVIGAGPAGLSCAWYLRLAGFGVTVYEEKPEAGGMVQQVIPSFRLPDNAIASDIKRIEALGVEIRYNTPVTKELFAELQRSGAFIFAAPGAATTRKLEIPGEEAQGVADPLVFLETHKKNAADKPHARRIIVLGGGNTAMDVARAARKTADQATSVTILYRRTLQDMPASAEEIMAAIHEGIEIKELVSPVEIITENNRAKALRCTMMEVSGTDESGRQKVKPVKNSTFVVEADLIIPAVGQTTRWQFADKELMQTGPDGFSTSLDKVYVGGDARKGASNIISAIADGRRAAEAITEKSGAKLQKNQEEASGKETLQNLMQKKAIRVRSLINAPSSNGHHALIQNNEQAQQEAARCLLCDEICNICVSVCPNFANQPYEVKPATYQLQKAVQQNSQTSLVEDQVFSITQKYQIYNLADFCNECGNCRTFCPTMGAPYQDKPKIHRTKESWDSAPEGFFVYPEGKGIAYKSPDSTLHKLHINPAGQSYTYETEGFSAQLNRKDLRIESLEFNNNKDCEVGIRQTVRMHALFTSFSKK